MTQTQHIVPCLARPLSLPVPLKFRHRNCHSLARSLIVEPAVVRVRRPSSFVLAPTESLYLSRCDDDGDLTQLVLHCKCCVVAYIQFSGMKGPMRAGWRVRLQSMDHEPASWFSIMYTILKRTLISLFIKFRPIIDRKIDYVFSNNFKRYCTARLQSASSSTIPGPEYRRSF